MNCVQKLAAAIALSLLLVPAAMLADEQDELRQEFEAVIEGLNDNSYDRFHRATDKKSLRARIYGSRLIEPQVKSAFSKDFSASLEQMFSSSFPRSKKDILGTVLDFKIEGNQGRAVVRYAVSGYRYSYHVYELQLDSRRRMKIVDWIDYYQGGRFSEEAGDALVMTMPTTAATRQMLKTKSLGEREVFQVSELFKAVRDNKAERFFQIYDDLDESLRKEAVIARVNLQLALMQRDGARIEAAVQALVEVSPDDPLFSLRLIEYYIPVREYQKAIDALSRLQQGLGFKDGATESLKASAALAMGNTEEAEEYALQATVVEPTLELSWWSLLRARTRAKDYSGATEALARLEDDFGHDLDPAKLSRDRFLKVLADKQEYLDWRASRQ